jgi:hypothetical protein
MCDPFALEIYRRFLGGESIHALSERLRIPEERIEQRLRAAAVYLEFQQESRRSGDRPSGRSPSKVN